MWALRVYGAALGVVAFALALWIRHWTASARPGLLPFIVLAAVPVLIVCAIEAVIGNLDICVVHQFTILLLPLTEVNAISLKGLESHVVNGNSRYPESTQVVGMFAETVLD